MFVKIAKAMNPATPQAKPVTEPLVIGPSMMAPIDHAMSGS